MMFMAKHFNQPLRAGCIESNRHDRHVQVCGIFQSTSGVMNVSRVTDMSGMFDYSSRFNQGKFLCTHWVNSTADQQSMFANVIQGSISEETDSCSCCAPTAQPPLDLSAPRTMRLFARWRK